MTSINQPDNPKPVLFMDTGVYAGPVFSVNRSIIRTLDRERYRPVVAVSSNMQGELKLPDDVEVTRWEFCRTSPRRRFITDRRRGIWGLTRFVQEQKVALLHCSQETLCSFSGIAVARATGTKVLIHQHTAPSRGGAFVLRRAAIDLADANLGISGFIAEEVMRSSLRKRAVDCVANAVDVSEFHPDVDGSLVRKEYGIAEHEILLVQLARFEPYKRQVDFVRAFALARREIANLRGLLVGWSDPSTAHVYRDAVLTEIREAGLADALTVVDARSDAANVHAAADAFVMPAVDEPFGLVVIEAMASGKAVLAVRSGALPEIVRDGETGLLTPASDPEALAQSIITVAKDAALRQRFGAAGRERVLRKYSEERLGPQVEQIYDRLCGQSLDVRPTGGTGT